MKLTIERADLLKSLAHVQSVVERRTTIPILSNVRLDGGGARLAVTATDMDLAVVENVAAEVDQDGATTAPAHTLYDIVRKLPDGAQVELETGGDGAHLSLSSGHARFSLPCQPADEFPVMAEGDFSHNFALAAASLRRLVDKARFAISTEETRYYLNGIYLHAVTDRDTGNLRAVATDGHRLSRVDVALPDGAAGMPGIIVPRKAVTELRKLIDEFDSDVAVSLSETKIRFAFDEVVLTSKLIDGTFPDYNRVIPSDNDKLLEIEGERFARAVDLVSTVSAEKTRSVKLAMSKGQLVISANSPDNASADEQLDVDYDADDMQIGFNSRYLLDVTGQVDGDRIRFAMADAASPTLVFDTSDDDALYVLMPMRV
ncbi:MAG: DNA polymerase III subunit beta [Pseudomonadota bacterium]|nr:DNA polymerase III subunit beta [Pseudomonadota bacterium]